MSFPIALEESKVTLQWSIGLPDLALQPHPSVLYFNLMGSWLSMSYTKTMLLCLIVVTCSLDFNEDFYLAISFVPSELV